MNKINQFVKLHKLVYHNGNGGTIEDNLNEIALWEELTDDKLHQAYLRLKCSHLEMFKTISKFQRPAGKQNNAKRQQVLDKWLHKIEGMEAL